MTGPVMPVREVLARLDKKTGAWIPCERTDLRGTLLGSYDALGRGVIPVFARSIDDWRIRGWRLGHAQDEEQAERFRVWMESNPEMEIVK